jgi:hypothetical protein
MIKINQPEPAGKNLTIDWRHKGGLDRERAAPVGAGSCLISAD